MSDQSSNRIAGDGASAEVQEFLNVFLPYCDKDDSTSMQARQTEWPNADTSGNGVLSLSMVERWIQRRLSASINPKRGTQLFKQFFPAYIRAFHAARDAPGTTKTNKDYVTRAEFRLLVSYLCIYALAYDAFVVVMMDRSSSSTTQDDQQDRKKDQRLTRNEWLAGCRSAANHGFVALKALAEVEDNNTDKLGQVFDEIDKDGGGMILLAEWCHYLQQTEQNAGTEMASLIEIKSSSSSRKSTDGSERQYDPIQVTESTRPNEADNDDDDDDALDRATIPEPIDISEIEEDDEYYAEPAASSTSKLEIEHANKIAGPGASDHVKSFLEVFLPLADTSAEEARDKEWPNADTYGNGTLDLTMIERWAQRRLCSTMMDAKEGTFVYKKYFSAIIRAFQATRDVPDAPSADYIDRKHFRLLVANLCFYALAIDAFGMIDDGKDASESNDQRLSLTEWQSGAHKTSQHGFVALSEDRQAATKQSMTAIFAQMDDNAGGTVLLTEFCNYLKNAEVEAGTPMGEMVTGSSLRLATIAQNTNDESTESTPLSPITGTAAGTAAATVLTVTSATRSASDDSSGKNPTEPAAAGPADASAAAAAAAVSETTSATNIAVLSGDNADATKAVPESTADEEGPDLESQKPKQEEEKEEIGAALAHSAETSGAQSAQSTSSEKVSSRSASNNDSNSPCLYFAAFFYLCSAVIVVTVIAYLATD